MTDEVARRSARAADRLLGADEVSFAAARERIGPEYHALLTAVRDSDARFAFDREGRPGAIDAVRAALPPAELELFDAILEDHACELAAVQEALFQLARAYGRRCRERT